MLHARATVGVFLLVLQLKCAVPKYFSSANKGVKNVAEDFLRSKIDTQADHKICFEYFKISLEVM